MDKQPLPDSLRAAYETWQREQQAYRQTGTREPRVRPVFERDLWVEHGPVTARVGLYPYSEASEYIGVNAPDAPRGRTMQLRASLNFKF